MTPRKWSLKKGKSVKTRQIENGEDTADLETSVVEQDEW